MSICDGLWWSSIPLIHGVESIVTILCHACVSAKVLSPLYFQPPNYRWSDNPGWALYRLPNSMIVTIFHITDDGVFSPSTVLNASLYRAQFSTISDVSLYFLHQVQCGTHTHLYRWSPHMHCSSLFRQAPAAPICLTGIWICPRIRKCIRNPNSTRTSSPQANWI